MDGKKKIVQRIKCTASQFRLYFGKQTNPKKKKNKKQIFAAKSCLHLLNHSGLCYRRESASILVVGGVGAVVRVLPSYC